MLSVGGEWARGAMEREEECVRARACSPKLGVGNRNNAIKCAFMSEDLEKLTAKLSEAG